MSHGTRLFCLITGSLALVATAQTERPPTELWSYQAGTRIYESPKFYPNVIEPTHIVVVSEEGAVSLVDPKGNALWKTELGYECLAAAGIGDLDGDGVAEIVVGLSDGTVVALDNRGAERWRYKMSGIISNYRCPVPVDLNGDAQCEVIITDDRGYVVCLSPLGERVWRFRIDRYYASPTAVADLDRDGELEIVYGTENDRVVCLTSRGTLKWVRAIEGKFARTAPTLGDVNADGYLDVAVTTSFNTPHAMIHVLSGPTGEILWSSPTVMWAYASNVIVDLDGDGSAEVICAGRGRRVHLFNADGSLRWILKLKGGGFYHETAVADITGDGNYELISGNRHGPGVDVIGDRGEALTNFGDDDCSVTPLVGDIDRDGKLELITARTNKGLLTCYQLDAPARESSVLWPSYRGDSANTGLGFYPNPAERAYPREETPGKLDVTLEARPVWGTNSASVDWPGSLPEKPLIQVSVNPERGVSQSDVLSMERDAPPETVPYALKYVGANTVSFTLFDGADGRSISTYSKTVMNTGKEGLSDWIGSRLNRLSEVSDRLLRPAPDVSAQLSQMRTTRETTLSVIQRLAEAGGRQTDTGHDRLMQTITDLRDGTEYDAQLAQRLGASDPETIPSVLIWPDSNPWDELDPWATLPNVLPSANLELPVWLYQNEFEDLALNFLNLTPEPITVQVRLDGDALTHLDVREAISVPRFDGTWVIDALSELNAARTIILPPGTIRQMWVVCDSKGLDAGIYEYPIELLQIGHANVRQNLTVQMEVADIDLAAAPSFMRCNWSSVGRIRGEGHSAERIAASVQAGMTVLYVTTPSRESDAQGDLVGEADWSQMDSELDLLTSDCFLFVSINVRAPKPVQFGDAIWSKAYRAWADELTAHLAEKGFPNSNWAIYPVDEPGLYDGPHIKRLMDHLVPVKAAAPDVQVYANPAGQITEENFRELLPYVDVWCPELGTLLRRPWMVDYFLADEGARVWCYEAPSSVKRLLPLGHYRAQSLIAFTLGLQGAGYWAQFHDDLWLSEFKDEYGALYASANIWVESRRWHATRDGTEDARAYSLVQKRAREAKERGLADGLVRQADALERDLRELMQRPILADDVTRHVIANYDPDLTELESLRKRAAKLTLELREALRH